MEISHWPFLLLIPLLMSCFFIGAKKQTLSYSKVDLIRQKKSLTYYKIYIGKFLIGLALILLVFALARPRILEVEEPLKDEGISIGLLLDVSGSMESVDFDPNRLAVAKKTIADFVNKRSVDEIALVPFAGNAYTRIPATTDYELLLTSLNDLTTKSVKEEGTAIGMALSVGVNRLKKSDTLSKVLILVTDGDNNAGLIDPLTAADLASEMGIRIYTIGVGTDETILPYTYFGTIRYQTMEGGLNEELLMEIADKTNGKYYRADDSKSLTDIFNTINQLERSELEVDVYRQYKELAYPLILAGLLSLCLGLFLDRFVFIQIP